VNGRRRTLSKSSDYLDALATTLRDLGGPTTIPHELAQNADDAGNATTIRFTVTDDALVVWNDGTFTDCAADTDTCSWDKRCDLHAFRRFAGRTKADDAATTGAFGVGFTSVYQITDTPELLYGDEHWLLDETPPRTSAYVHVAASALANTDSQARRSCCRGSARLAPFEPLSPCRTSASAISQNWKLRSSQTPGERSCSCNTSEQSRSPPAPRPTPPRDDAPITVSRSRTIDLSRAG
jgi:hypothetical protein